MRIPDTELQEKLTEAISLHMPSSFGCGSQLALIPPVSFHRRYSFFFRYWVRLQDGEMKPLLVKIPRESWMKTLQEAIESKRIREVVKGEFETMISIANFISESGRPMLYAIRPKAILLEYNALLMEEAPIRMLKTSLAKLSIILGMKKDWQDFEIHLKLAGEWLKVIHTKFSTGQSATLESLKAIEDLNNSLSFLEQFQACPLNTLRNLFFFLYDFINIIKLPLTSLHNDYHPGNIFVTDSGRIGALDPNWVESGPVYVDLASLLIYPVTRKMQIITLGFLFRIALRRRYEDAVLRGYFSDSRCIYPVLYFYCAAATLEKWRDNEMLLKTSCPGRYSFIAWLIAPLIRFYYHRLIKDYLKQGLKAWTNFSH